MQKHVVSLTGSGKGHFLSIMIISSAKRPNYGFMFVSAFLSVKGLEVFLHRISRVQRFFTYALIFFLMKFCKLVVIVCGCMYALI